MKRKYVAIKDLYVFKFLREIALSPDGGCIAYTVEWMDKKKNRYYSNLFVVDNKGKKRQFIRGNKDIKLPEWSPNGKYISFIRTDTEKNEVKQALWLIPADGGEAFKLTDSTGSFGYYTWTPDSKYIICEFTGKKEDKERIPEKGKPPLYYHITRSWYKYDGRGMLPEEKPHLWRINARSGKMKQLTFGINGDHSPCVSSDGKKIAFVSNRQKEYEDKLLYYDIFVISSDGTKERRIPTPPGPKGSPVFSPDGRSIAYTGRKDPNFRGWRSFYLWKVPVRGGRAVNLTSSFDRTFEALTVDDMGHYARTRPIFSSDGRFLYHNTAEHGNVNVYAVDVKKKKVVKVLGDTETIYAFDFNGHDTFALASSNPVDPGNLYLVKEGKRKQLTDINARYVKAHRLAHPEEFWFKGDGNKRVQGWIMKPPNFSPKKKYPLIVQIHGGPHAAYGNSLFHEFQVLAANGYIVFYSNPHGSVGYGQKFAQALHNRWGIPDTKDIKKAVRLLTKRSYIDQRRMGVMGGSYGGFMTNWIIGHTNMFKVAVTMRCVASMFTQFSSDFGFARDRMFKGHWWKNGNFKFYWDMSPIKYVTRIKTPLLIIHSEEDHRCPIAQAEELFVSLKLLKQDVEMVRFPGESHGLSRHGSPLRREKRLEFILKFIDRYLQKKRGE